MTHPLKKLLAHTLITSVMFLGFTQSVQASMISTEQVVTVAAAAQNRAKVSAELQKMGISTDEARARVAAMTDAETASIAKQVDTLPAGGDVISTLVFIFVLLLITDILGFTKVFPFTRSLRN